MSRQNAPRANGAGAAPATEQHKRNAYEAIHGRPSKTAEPEFQRWFAGGQPYGLATARVAQALANLEMYGVVLVDTESPEVAPNAAKA